MLGFFRAYPDPARMMPQPVAQIPAADSVLRSVPWGHHALLLEKLKDRQYPITVGDEDFYIDLLFYHLRLRCFVAIDLKKGAFKAEHAGKMNFYLNVVDDKLRHETDAPTIGLILCQDRNRVIAEYALQGMNKPIGISEYELTRTLPRELQSNLPTIEAIEAELAGTSPEKPAPKRLTAKTKRASKKHSRPS